MARSRRRKRSHTINPNASTQRTGMRMLGIVMTVAGAIFMITGFASFFSAMDMHAGPPKKTWCIFVGVPLLGIGLQLLRLGYMGSIARYVAGEAAPVATDTIKHVANETRGSMRDLAGAVAEGLRNDPEKAATADMIACPKCQHDNDHDARFCDMCGTAMPTPKTCGKCSKVNDDDARFCSDCGTALK